MIAAYKYNLSLSNEKLNERTKKKNTIIPDILYECIHLNIINMNILFFCCSMFFSCANYSVFLLENAYFVPLSSFERSKDDIEFKWECGKKKKSSKQQNEKWMKSSLAKWDAINAIWHSATMYVYKMLIWVESRFFFPRLSGKFLFEAGFHMKLAVLCLFLLFAVVVLVVLFLTCFDFRLFCFFECLFFSSHSSTKLHTKIFHNYWSKRSYSGDFRYRCNFINASLRIKIQMETNDSTLHSNRI